MANKRLTTLKVARDFENLKKFGKKNFPAKWILIVVLENDLKLNRFGWTISKKIGPAVLRNKYKRWCREFFRKNTDFSKFYDINVIFRPQTNNKFYKELKHETFCEVMEMSFKHYK